MIPAENPPAAAATQPSRPLAQNRRQGIRHRLHIPATLMGDGENPAPIPVTVTELSIGGVGIHAEHELKLDGIYHLNSFDTLITPGTRVRIISQRELPAGKFEIGAKAL
jgi:hypothetical protein